MARKVVFIIAAAALLYGCAAPPKLQKIDTASIPVKGGSAPTSTGSIWPGENSRNALFQDLRAKNVGDVVTVQITEKTSAVKEASTSTSRQSSADIGIQKFLGLPLDFGMRDFLGSGAAFSPEVQASYDAGFDGSGTTKRSGELSAIIATRVTEVMANGNLVLEGRKEILVNNEHQFIILSGIARPEDINEQNIIPSILLSDARIEYDGKGVIADEQSPGWMRRLLDNAWPF